MKFLAAKEFFMNLEIIYLLIAGACGALAKDLIEDGAIQIPFRSDGKFYLGFLSSLIVGAFAGYAIDGSLITAAMGGYMGSSTITKLLANGKAIVGKVNDSIENLIQTIATQECVDPGLAIRVAKAESNLNPQAINTNKDGSRDRGLYQINDKWHPEVSDNDAFNPTKATLFFCKAFKAGNLKWWDASKAKWDI